MKKNLKIYNDIWFDCYINMKITLLRKINEKFDCIAFENNYIYDFPEHITGGNAKFNVITVNQKMLSLNNFANVAEVTNYSREGFIKRIKLHLSKENSFALVAVDLYNWLEGSLCWKKHHWYHYSLLVEYDYNIKKFKVIDELNGKYVEFYVDEKKLYNSIAFESSFKTKAKLLSLLDNYKMPEITLENIVANAEKIINGLQRNIHKDFWLLPENDYIAKSYRDLSGVYLQRIEGRQKGNVKLIEVIKEMNILPHISYKHYYQGFTDLSNLWSKNRLFLYKLYLDSKNRKKNYEKLNSNIKICMKKEVDIWSEMIKEINM